MNVVKIILGIIFLIDCIALTIVVLMQEGKQQGLGAIAGAAETYWGKNKGRSMEGGKINFFLRSMSFLFILLLCIYSSYLKINCFPALSQ